MALEDSDLVTGIQGLGGDPDRGDPSLFGAGPNSDDPRSTKAIRFMGEFFSRHSKADTR